MAEAFHATIKEGKLSFGPILLKRFEDFLHANDGKQVTIELDTPRRSESQNRYYWLYLEVIARETGNDADDLHELFKRKFLPPAFKTIMGQEVKLPGSTTDLDKAGFSEYLERICALTNVPLPDPEAAGYISNYRYWSRAMEG
jgi:hypothetical protein